MNPYEAVTILLKHIGEDPTRDGLLDTPRRVIRSYGELFSGYGKDPKDVMTVFDDVSDEMVIVSGIEFQSTCEHHMLPFVGKAHIAYIPSTKVIGVSKLVRVLEIYTRRLQIQERICKQVTDALDAHLTPLGSACVLSASHMCMACRGVRQSHSKMITSSLTGVFKQDARARSEFLSMISQG